MFPWKMERDPIGCIIGKSLILEQK
ncbi:hypothetical protein NC651_002584 [Populus alba x Populus x berolinensis]|nr:hypothetical protein NC651_002584 [Populus alba x Populus x berolinensis]